MRPRAINAGTSHASRPEAATAPTVAAAAAAAHRACAHVDLPGRIKFVREGEGGRERGREGGRE